MSRRGASIIEVLAVVAIIAIITAILIPTLRSLRLKGKDAEDLSNLAQTLKDFNAYAAANRDRVVNAGLPGSPDSAWFHGSPDDHGGDFFLSQSTCWNRVLARWAGRLERHWHSSHEQFLIDFGGGEIVDPRRDYPPDYPYLSLPTAYVMPDVMLMKASAWTNPPLRIPLEQMFPAYYKVLTFGEVRHPAAKGLLIHALRPGEPKLYHVALADGSVRTTDLNTGKPTAIPPWPGPLRPGRPVYATLFGYEGVDF